MNPVLPQDEAQKYCLEMMKDLDPKAPGRMFGVLVCTDGTVLRAFSGTWDGKLEIPGYDEAMLASKEVHELFNVTPGSTFINTKTGQDSFEPISEDFEVAADLSIEDFLKTIKLNNLTTGKTITVPTTAGEPPYAIIVPLNFAYPLETVCIKDAYSKFTEWVQTNDQTIYWYLDINTEKVYPNNE